MVQCSCFPSVTDSSNQPIILSRKENVKVSAASGCFPTMHSFVQINGLIWLVSLPKAPDHGVPHKSTGFVNSVKNPHSVSHVSVPRNHAKLNDLSHYERGLIEPTLDYTSVHLLQMLHARTLLEKGQNTLLGLPKRCFFGAHYKILSLFFSVHST